MHLTVNETILSALLHGNLLERDASVNRAVAHDAARQIVATRHYAILSPSRDLLRHHATLASPHASPSEKAQAKEAIERTGHAALNAGLDHPANLDNDPKAHASYHATYNAHMNGRLAGALSVAGHRFVRAIGGYKETGSSHGHGIPTEGSFVIPGHHAGAHMRLRTATDLGHAFAQDSVIYSGPETGHEPRLLGLHYHADGSAKMGSHDNWAAFDPGRVRAVTPGDAHRQALSGGTVAFTHAYDPHGDPLHHALPRQDINQIAFRLLPRSARAHVADVSH